MKNEAAKAIRARLREIDAEAKELHAERAVLEGALRHYTGEAPAAPGRGPNRRPLQKWEQTAEEVIAALNGTEKPVRIATLMEKTGAAHSSIQRAADASPRLRKEKIDGRLHIVYVPTSVRPGEAVKG